MLFQSKGKSRFSSIPQKKFYNINYKRKKNPLHYTRSGKLKWWHNPLKKQEMSFLNLEKEMNLLQWNGSTRGADGSSGRSKLSSLYRRWADRTRKCSNEESTNFYGVNIINIFCKNSWFSQKKWESKDRDPKLSMQW